MKYLEDRRKSLTGQAGTAAPKTQTTTVEKKPLATQKAGQTPAQKTATTAPAQTQSAAQPAKTTQTPAAQTQNTSTAPAQTASAADQAQQLLSQQPGAYKSKWGNSIDSVLERLMNSTEFTYDPMSDPLYLMLRDQGIRDGKLAMEDTMGQAAQLTGGYGNSHAQMLGQQTYQGYLNNVNEMVPDLKEAARAEYDAKNDALLQQLGLMMDQESQDYSRYLDEIERQRYEEELAYSREQDALANQRYDDELAYGRSQDAYDRLVEMITATGYQPTAEEMAAAGMTEQQAKAWLSYYNMNEGYSGSGGGSSGGGGGSAGGGGTGGGGVGGGGGGTLEPQATSVEIAQNARNQLPTLPGGQNGLPTTPDATTIYAKALKYRDNGASATEIYQYIRSAYDAGHITEKQYQDLMNRFNQRENSMQ